MSGKGKSRRILDAARGVTELEGRVIPLCQFLYNGHTGPRGKICGRPEAEHCPESIRLNPSHQCEGRNKKPVLVHHPFQRAFKCPTCGTREVKP